MTDRRTVAQWTGGREQPERAGSARVSREPRPTVELGICHAEMAVLNRVDETLMYELGRQQPQTVAPYARQFPVGEARAVEAAKKRSAEGADGGALELVARRRASVVPLVHERRERLGPRAFVGQIDDHPSHGTTVIARGGVQPHGRPSRTPPEHRRRLSWRRYNTWRHACADPAGAVVRASSVPKWVVPPLTSTNWSGSSTPASIHGRHATYQRDTASARVSAQPGSPLVEPTLPGFRQSVCVRA